MKTECPLCTFEKDYSESSLFLYAATPVLREVVASQLQDFRAQFQLEDETFRILEDQNLAIQGLRIRLSDEERAEIRVGRERGAAMLAAPTLDAYGRRLETTWFEEALRNDQFTTFFQPVVDIRSSDVFAHECLIRLFSDRPYTEGEIIDAAISRGRIHLFDSYARRLSIRKAGEQCSTGSKVFINFMPSSIYDPAYCMASTLEELSKTRLQPKDIVFEVVESDQVRDVDHLRKISEYCRKEGFGFALDDVGAGPGSLQMVSDLKPDYIKVDKSVTAKITEPTYQNAVRHLAEMADQYGLQVIAEGVESFGKMEVLRSLGVHLMQGYYFGKPALSMSFMSIDTPVLS